MPPDSVKEPLVEATRYSRACTLAFVRSENRGCAVGPITGSGYRHAHPLVATNTIGASTSRYRGLAGKY